MLRGKFNSWLVNGDIAYLAAILVMVIMPLNHSFLPPLMILLGFCWIYQNYSGFQELITSRSKYKSLFILFVAFYLWQIISLLYSSDLRMGWSNVFGRLSIFIFPLIFYSPAEKIRVNAFRLLRIFALSSAGYCLACLSYALFRSLSLQSGTWVFNPHPPEFDWLNYFFGPELTLSIHPSYLAMYVLISVFISFESWYDHSLKKHTRIGWIILGIFLLISIYFISSRSAIFASLIMIPFYATIKIIKYKKTRFIWIIVVIVMILSMPFLRKNERVNYFLSGILSEKKFVIRDKDERIIIWESAIKIIKNHPVLGVGIGDVRTELVNEYFRKGEDKFARQRLNAHNQFIEVFLEGGVIEFSIFMTVLVFMIFIAIKEKNLLYGLFIVMMCIFFMFETILHRLAGVSFFSLFSFILLHINKEGIISKIQNNTQGPVKKVTS
jgi:O-antigen ligase